jgi:hypothetical protein
MNTASACSICHEGCHKAAKCPCLYDALKEGFFSGGGSGGGGHSHDEDEDLTPPGDDDMTEDNKDNKDNKDNRQTPSPVVISIVHL